MFIRFALFSFLLLPLAGGDCVHAIDLIFTMVIVYYIMNSFFIYGAL